MARLVAASLLLVGALLATVGPVAAKRVVVDMEVGTNADGSMYARPPSFTAQEGDEVALTVHNPDAMFHDIAILDPCCTATDGRSWPLEMELNPGETETRTFRVDEAGAWEYLCEVRGHKAAGMVGTMTVTQGEGGGDGTPAPPVGAILAGAAVVALGLSRMRPRRPHGVVALSLCVVVVLAGCTDRETKPPPPTGLGFTDDFDGSEEIVPPGWEVVDGEWGLSDEENATSAPHVLEATNDGEGFPHVLAPAGTYDALDAEVRFNVLSGANGQAAGILYRYTDADNYDVVRVNLLEQNVRLFSYQDGQRLKVASGDLVGDFALGEWHTLAIQVRGDEVVAFVDGAELMRAEEAVNQVGEVGLWTKDDSTTWFDDFSVEPPDA